jgi:hypothetical protein
MFIDVRLIGTGTSKSGILSSSNAELLLQLLL